jgi:hypothetical protein
MIAAFEANLATTTDDAIIIAGHAKAVGTKAEQFCDMLARGVLTPAGCRHWYAAQVAQLLTRLEG